MGEILQAGTLDSAFNTVVQARPTEFLDLTSVTLDEFQQLVPFEAAFHVHLATWHLDGKPRTARRFTVYKNCPLPTPEDRRFFILTYLKTSALQVVQGRLFGMGQGIGLLYITLVAYFLPIFGYFSVFKTAHYILMFTQLQ